MGGAPRKPPPPHGSLTLTLALTTHPDPTPNQAKLVWQPFYQLMHFWSLFPIHLVLGVLVNPVTYPLAAAYLAAPPATQRRGALLGMHPC